MLEIITGVIARLLFVAMLPKLHDEKSSYWSISPVAGTVMLVSYVSNYGLESNFLFIIGFVILDFAGYKRNKKTNQDTKYLYSASKNLEKISKQLEVNNKSFHVQRHSSRK